MVFPRPVKAVVFDMDGLLINTEVLWREGMIGAAKAMGRELSMDAFRRMIGSPAARTREILHEEFGADFDVDGFLDDASRRFHDELDLENLLKAGVVELLDHLDARGLPRAIATSSTHESVEAHLTPSGVLARFDAVVARGDYERGKPAPDPFLNAAKALGVAPEDCLALEDSHTGVRAAHAAGMMTVMVPDLLDPTEEMREKCVHVAKSLHRVRELLGA
jgi:HAD superfamily hydrolase (TIGR01509 family)